MTSTPAAPSRPAKPPTSAEAGGTGGVPEPSAPHLLSPVLPRETHKADVPLPPVRASSTLPFSPGDFCVSPDGKIAIAWNVAGAFGKFEDQPDSGGPQAKGQQLAAVDLASGKVLASRCHGAGQSGPLRGGLNCTTLESRSIPHGLDGFQGFLPFFPDTGCFCCFFSGGVASVAARSFRR